MRPSHWHVEKIVASDGNVTVRVNGKLLHSKVAPLREADKWASQQPEAPAYAIVGAGMGWGVQALLKRFPTSKIVVLEPVPGLIPDLQSQFNGYNGSIRIVSLANRINASVALSSIQQHLGSDYRIVEGYPNAAEWDNSGIVDRLRFRSKLSQQPPRVLVVTPIYGGSYPIAQYCVNGLRMLGCTVELLDNAHLDPARQEIDTITDRPDHKQQLTGILVSFAAERIAAKAAAMKADLVLALAQAPVTSRVWDELRNAGVATAFWFVEDHRLFPYGSNIAPRVDAFFPIQCDEWTDELSKQGAHLHYLPLAADESIHSEVELNEFERGRFGSDLSFVGAGYYNRRNAFLTFIDQNMKIWGDGWRSADGLSRLVQEDGRRISTEESIKIFSASKVNINLHSSTYYQDVSPDGDFVNPRTFEIAACRAFQVIDERSLLPELFSPEEMPTAGTLDQFRMQVNSALADSGYRQQTTELAYNRVVADHLYTHRMEELLGYVFRNRSPLSHSAMGQVSVEKWIEEAGDDPDLVEYLTRFRDRKRLTLSEIAEEIESRRERLSSTESVFLLMNEFYKWGKEHGVI